MTYKILIVDDEMTIRMGLKAMVSKLDNWQWVGEASNGVQAIEMIRQCRPDLILSDIRMPQMDGIAMLEQIRGIGSDALLIFLTGYPDFTYARQAIRYGAFDYLLKPMRAAEIMDVLRKAENQIVQKRKAGADTKRNPSDSEESESENRMRAILYGGGREAFDHPSLSIFRECTFFTAVSLCADIPLANEEDFGEMHERIGRRHAAYKALKEGRHDWIVLLGWKDGEDVDRRLRELTSELTSPYWSQAGPVQWKIGVGHRLPADQASLSYDQCKFAASLASPEKRVVYYEEISGDDPNLQVVPIELEFAMIKSIKKGDKSEALSLFADLQTYYKRMVLPQLGRHALHLQLKLQASLSFLGESGADQGLMAGALPSSHQPILDRLLAAISHYSERADKHWAARVNHTVKRVIGLVHDRYFSDLKLSDIALELGVNSSYLSTLFKQETGMLFTEYLSRYRMDKSLSLLQNPLKKIYEVAQDVGYADGRHFSQIFRKTYGMTPLDFRNRNGVAADPDKSDSLS